jgi:hypothetical protein
MCDAVQADASHIIVEDEVPRVFDDACIARLVIGQAPDAADRPRFADSAREAARIQERDARIVRSAVDRLGLPDAAAWRRFADGVREAARMYAGDARTPSVGEMRGEIARLHRAAARREYERVADLIEALSPEARRRLQARASTPGFNNAKLKMPPPEALRDPARREPACDVVRRFCSLGRRYIEGRMRPSGKRSRTGQPLLHAPKPLPHPPKRDAERQFVINLQLAWLEATGEKPTATVNPSRPDQPFANFVRECLKLVGACHADAVGLINELSRRRREMNRRSRLK